MNPIPLVLCVAVLSATLGDALGKERSKVRWHDDVDQAWQKSQASGRPMVVFVTKSQCYYCEKMKADTWAHNAVSGQLQADFVPLALDGGAAIPLLKELRVKAYPATFVISPQAVILDRMDGYIGPDVLQRRLQGHVARPPTAKLARDP